MSSKYKEYKRKYREAHKEEIQAYRKKYREAHKKEIQARDRAYRETHKKEAQAYGKEYRKRNKEERQFRNKMYHSINRVRLSQKGREYYHRVLKKRDQRIDRTEYLNRIRKSLQEWTSSAKDEKVRARLLVERAVRKKRLIKPKICEQCGRIALLHGHHRNYSLWWEVEWLCPLCHRRRTVLHRFGELIDEVHRIAVRLKEARD